ncbi:head GIN domain-containing protein [Noviherbaspirillum autotrophicum]|uniref:Putative auto-transporter adhesin head GIN domain-containing protein n=1 Tax=Noviherbaspirillum autotrophicum TaxID=709839 RepID=A0A0C2BMM0_9BURK|nr:head GIN domain-containing protein [Noviherbaspirillum autotrophicum]KIF82490.1 hypothetical protein TSA66_19400 [Noviherbaspirillum autotrophicum]
MKLKSMRSGLLAAGLALMSLSACADVVTQPAAGVTRVQFKLPGELQIRYGTQEKLTIDADAKVIPMLDIAVKGDSLVLASKRGFRTDKDLKFTLTIRSLQSVKSEGSGNVVIENFAGGNIEVDAAGSGNMRLKDIKPGRLAILIEGSGAVDAFGSGETVIARITGSGNIDTTNFRARTVEADISGSGDIKVHADDKLKADISGAGNIEYRGKAKVTQSVSGAGSVDRL